jgi:hypothetical protein
VSAGTAALFNVRLANAAGGQVLRMTFQATTRRLAEQWQKRFRWRLTELLGGSSEKPGLKRKLSKPVIILATAARRS